MFIVYYVSWINWTSLRLHYGRHPSNEMVNNVV